MDDYEIRELRAGDEGSLLGTFDAVFPAAARTRDEWSWSFERNPGGRRVFVAVHCGRVVAQYAALPARTWIDGSEQVFAQIVDSMVAPEHRAGLKRPGLFVLTARAFFDAYGSPQRDWVFYGWPIAAAWRVGRRLLDYELVQPELVLAREVDARVRAAPEQVCEMASFDVQARWLWERCAGEFGASAIRDASYLNWRFVERPRVTYHRFGVHADGVLRGYAVLRGGDWPLERTALIVDWLVPPAEREVGDALLAACERRGRDLGCRHLVTSLPSWSPWFEHLQQRGFEVHPSAYLLAARSFHPRIDAWWLREHWWHTLADSDLV